MTGQDKTDAALGVGFFIVIGAVLAALLWNRYRFAVGAALGIHDE